MYQPQLSRKPAYNQPNQNATVTTYRMLDDGNEGLQHFGHIEFDVRYPTKCNNHDQEFKHTEYVQFLQ